MNIIPRRSFADVTSVFYILLTENIPANVYHNFFESLPEQIKTNIGLYVLDNDRHTRIIGKVLLAYALKKNGLKNTASLDGYSYSKHNKPFLSKSTSFFSITHSRNMVVCAISSEQSIGIDTENILPVNLDYLKAYFDQNDWYNIKNANNPTLAFYRHWTLKEAALKASDRAISSIELQNVVVRNDCVYVDEYMYLTKPLALHADYITSIAFSKNLTDIITEELTIDYLSFAYFS